MMILSFFVKKIKENKIHMVISSIIFSLGLFLVCFFISLSYNFSNNISLIFENKKSYIYAEKNDTSDISEVEHQNIAKKLAISSSNLVVDAVDKISVNIDVFEVENNKNFDYISDFIIEGKNTIDNKSILISKSIVDECGMNSADIIGKSAVLSNHEYYTITGIYDDSEYYLPDCIILCENKIFEPKTYLIKAIDIESVPKIVSELEREGFTVKSNCDEIKDSIESNSILSSVIVLFVVFSLVFVVAILYSMVMNMIRDMYPFIAMIKAIGYRKKECFLLILTSSSFIFVLSSILTLLFYFIGMPFICKILVEMNVLSIYNVNINILFNTNVFVPMIELLVALIGMIIADIFLLNKIEKMQVYEILNEGNI